MDNRKFDEVMVRRDIHSVINSLTLYRNTGYIEECRRRRQSTAKLTHVISNLLGAEQTLLRFLKENPTLKNFNDMKNEEPQKYNWIREEIVDYCNEYYYKI